VIILAYIFSIFHVLAAEKRLRQDKKGNLSLHFLWLLTSFACESEMLIRI